ncbi:hypothetical protein ALNOE001_09600 [Candidatus Methanobinarius endosymbioticus]|uniref:Uncharacterized protein n=1 Tax=Candidatus Methanobinarius endosymbioticus TaxID=2006182 RepID=A0A366MB22_9EURY|nr:hypothetical protein ALNOE001_09600 [Candidatus Methanobinarius endosymbioticus]
MRNFAGKAINNFNKFIGLSNYDVSYNDVGGSSFTSTPPLSNITNKTSLEPVEGPSEADRPPVDVVGKYTPDKGSSVLPPFIEVPDIDLPSQDQHPLITYNPPPVENEATDSSYCETLIQNETYRTPRILGAKQNRSSEYSESKSLIEDHPEIGHTTSARRGFLEDIIQITNIKEVPFTPEFTINGC